jgi:hypothetical protein
LRLQKQVAGIHWGDVTPLNLWGEIWLALEVLLGYIMLGGLISILANELARRS